MSEQELQLGLARLLPEKVCWHAYPNMGNPINLYQWGTEFDFNCVTIGETEWLHVCWLVEQSFNDEEFIQFSDELTKARLVRAGTSYTQAERETISASWQWRAEAILKLNPTSNTHDQ